MYLSKTGSMTTAFEKLPVGKCHWSRGVRAWCRLGEAEWGFPERNTANCENPTVKGGGTRGERVICWIKDTGQGNGLR